MSRFRILDISGFLTCIEDMGLAMRRAGTRCYILDATLNAITHPAEPHLRENSIALIDGETVDIYGSPSDIRTARLMEYSGVMRLEESSRGYDG